MKVTKLIFIGRWVADQLPEIANLAMKQANQKAILTDLKDTLLLDSAFREFYNYDFSQEPDIPARRKFEHRIKYAALFLSCYEPASINGPYHGKTPNHYISYLSRHLKWNRSSISRNLPVIRFFIAKRPEFSTDVLTLVAMVRLKISERAASEIK